MRTLLINPPATVHRRFFKQAEPFSLGLASVGATARARGHEVAILDAYAEGLSQQRREGEYIHAGLSDGAIARRIRDWAPDLIGISCPFTVQFNNAVKVARIARQVAQATLVCGGAHVTAMPRTFAPGTVDYLVRGEGELAFADLADQLSACCR